jgi:hypothetical protein
MAGGRPTADPKGTLVAVRLADRQLGVLQARARREGIALSEALRRCLDEWAARAQSTPSPRSRPPTPEERESFEQVFAALGLKPRRPSRRR